MCQLLEEKACQFLVGITSSSLSRAEDGPSHKCKQLLSSKRDQNEPSFSLGRETALGLGCHGLGCRLEMGQREHNFQFREKFSLLNLLNYGGNRQNEIGVVCEREIPACPGDSREQREGVTWFLWGPERVKAYLDQS